MKYTYLLLFIIGTFLSLNAQEKENKLPNFTIKAAAYEPMPDSIVVRFCKGIISESQEFSEIIRLKTKNNKGNFTFSFSKEQSISPFVIDFYYGRLNQWTVMYYAEPTDKIEIEVTKGIDTTIGHKHNVGSLQFSGNGAAKYRLCEILNQMNANLASQEVKTYTNEFGNPNYKNNEGIEVHSSKDKIESKNYYKSKQFDTFLKNMFRNLDLGKKEIQDTLMKYQDLIGKEMTNFYEYELGYNLTFLSIIDFLIKRVTNEAAKEKIIKFYFLKIDSLRPMHPKDSLFKFGVKYRNRTSYYLMYDTYLKNKFHMYSFSFQYNNIKKVKDKELRDILLTKYFVNGKYSAFINNSESRDSCLMDALKVIANPELLTALNNQLLFSKGNKIYDFAFQDTTKKTVTKSNFKGKVFMMDFYYYGCGACAVFAKRFEKEIYPEFANNPNFKVLSINTDLKRETWLKAINSGLYTQPSSINLSTGLGFNHPLLKYYKVSSFPWVILVNKDGRVVEFQLSKKSNSDLKGIIRRILCENKEEKTSK